MAFRDWLRSLNVTSSASTHTVACVSATRRGRVIPSASPFFSSWISAVVKSAALSLPVHARFRGDVGFHFLGRGPTGRTAGSCGNSVPLLRGPARLFSAATAPFDALTGHAGRRRPVSTPAPALLRRLSVWSPWRVCGGGSRQI